MPEQLVSAVYLISGVVVMASGVGVTRQRLKQVLQARRKTAWVSAAMPEGWRSWFFEGFSTVTAGARLTVSLVLLAACLLVGTGLVGVGLRLAW